MLSAVLAVHLMWTSKSNTSNKASVHSADAIAACEWLHKDSNNGKSFLQFCFCQNESLNWYLFIPWPQISFHSPELLLTLQWLISLTVIFHKALWLMCSTCSPGLPNMNSLVVKWPSPFVGEAPYHSQQLWGVILEKSLKPVLSSRQRSKQYQVVLARG